jgi:protein-S-isoprenylcysteine O-methyltransferase Ste14
MRLATKVVLATTGFAVLHSVLASSTAKSVAARTVRPGGDRYRLFFNAQAVVTFAALVGYIGRQPKRTIYRVTGLPAVLMRLGQASGIVFAVAAVRATGVARLAGLDTLDRMDPAEDARPPAAQGPERTVEGMLAITGPFKVVRHPLNLAPLPPFWLTPHLTGRRLAFNIISTLYLIVGSVHEERRLTAKYGDEYRRYQRSGIPFYFPALCRRRE